MRQSVLKRSSILKELLAPYRLPLFVTIFFGIISGTATVLMTYYIGLSIDALSLPNSSQPFSQALQRFLLCLLLASTTQWLLMRLANKISYQSVTTLRKKGLDKLQRLPVSYFDYHSKGDTISRFTNDLDFVAEALIGTITIAFSGISLILVAIVMMFKLNSWLALCVIVMTPLMFITTWTIATKSQQSFKEQQQIVGRMTGFMTERFADMTLIKLYQQEKNSTEQYREMNHTLQHAGQRAQFISSLSNPLSRFIDHLGYIIIGFVGAYLIFFTSSTLTIGMMTTFIIYANQFTKPFIELSGLTTQIQSALAGLNRIEELVNSPDEPAYPSKSILQPEQVRGKVVFEQVDFQYYEHQPLIENFNLEVAPGETIAIVGETGAGKTTIVNLLMRYYPLTRGEIYVDDVPLSQLSQTQLRSLFGIVLQETWLHQGTILENLTYGLPNASLEDVKKGAALAQIDTFIEQLPLGYDTPVNSQHLTLSEGQKQLLSIARTIIANPPMLILDEATSSVDTMTELAIQRAFQEMMKNKTSFIIAHRLSTIKQADKILVMSKGQIVEVGSHEELMTNTNGYYRRLYETQLRGD